MKKKGNQVVIEVLVQWANIVIEDATWEEYHKLLQQFPNFCSQATVMIREDKDVFKRGKLIGYILSCGP